MTLYRIDEELAEMLARDEGPSLGAIIRRGIQVGVLVPVEPDETGAIDAAYRRIFHLPGKSEEWHQDYARQIALAVLDAALGVGEETP